MEEVVFELDLKKVDLDRNFWNLAQIPASLQKLKIPHISFLQMVCFILSFQLLNFEHLEIFWKYTLYWYDKENTITDHLQIFLL